MNQNQPMELGVQPLDAILTQFNLANNDLVAASTEQLTHKMVHKGRTGRRLTPNVKSKILNALNASVKDRKFKVSELFNY